MYEMINPNSEKQNNFVLTMKKLVRLPPERLFTWRNNAVIFVTTLTQKICDAKIAFFCRKSRKNVVTDFGQAIAERGADDVWISALKKVQKSRSKNLKPKSETNCDSWLWCREEVP